MNVTLSNQNVADVVAGIAAEIHRTATPVAYVDPTESKLREEHDAAVKTSNFARSAFTMLGGPKSGPVWAAHLAAVRAKNEAHLRLCNFLSERAEPGVEQFIDSERHRYFIEDSANGSDQGVVA